MRFDSCVLLAEFFSDALDCWLSLPREWRTPDFLPVVGDYIASLAGDTLGCNIFCTACTDHRRNAPNMRRYHAFFTFEPRGCGAETALLFQ